MAQLRDIKQRIESVKKTRKMTQAMKMVAAAKFKRATERVMKARPYLLELESILGLLSSQLGQGASSLFEDNESEKELVILISGDRGLCGGFNSNIIKFANHFLTENEKPCDLILFGVKGYQFFKSSGREIVSHYEKFTERVTLSRVESVFTEIISLYEQSKYRKIWLFYNEFSTALSSHLIKKQLLPIQPLKSVQDRDEKSLLMDYFLEPSPEAVADYLSKEYVFLSAFKGFLESFAAEQGARMASMDSATDNAADMIRSLTLEYNRQRQAQITTELSEIVAGAESLVS